MLNQCQQLILDTQDLWHQSFQFDEHWQCEQLNPKSNYANRVITGRGAVFEKAGIAMSQLHGENLPKAANERYPHLAGKPFDVVGVSLIFHPQNPFVPSVHANLRFFQCDKQWWFGGGMDLTPYYPEDADCQHWHRTLKKVCDQFSKSAYPSYKEWCDRYFYLKHRKEMRGIGGIFFDDLTEPGFKAIYSYIKGLGECFVDAYKPILEKHIDTPYSEKERAFQLYRRARYAEFNLLYDRGTLFGLQYGGRIESILMSMPPMASWPYQWQPEKNSPEAQLDRFLQPNNWVD